MILNELVANLMIYIATVSGGFGGDLGYDSKMDIVHEYGLPEVQFVSREQLFLMRFQRKPSSDESLNVQAIQFGHTIYLHEDWDAQNLKDQSILLHELVHIMQDNNNFYYNCDGDKERLAYYIQEKWLLEEQEFSQEGFYKALSLHPLVMVSAMTCIERQIQLAKPWQAGP